MKSNVREAALIVADKIRRGEIANLNEAVIEAAGGPLEYVLAAYESAMRKDSAGLERNARDASMSGAMVQLEIPGLDHAAFPFWIKVKDDETGEWIGVPPSLATLDQIDVEVSKIEQTHATRGKIIAGFRATITRLRDLDVPGDTTGAEIEAMFPREVGA